MITNTGKSILAKYLVGQTPSYASHIAIGCGAKPIAALSFAISEISKIDKTATIKTVEPHGLIKGQTIDVVSDDVTFNGTFTILSTTSDTISYLVSSSGTVVTTAATGFIYLNYKNKERLDFEIARVPILSRGYVTEESETLLDEFGNPERISKIVFTAELPTTDRYEISEIGVYSALSNVLASTSDSRALYSFSSNEGWAYHSATGNAVTSIPNISGRLDGSLNDNSISNDAIEIPGSSPSAYYQVFQAQGSNSIFLSDYRTKRFEQPRYLDNTIFIVGNNSKIDLSANGTLDVVDEWSEGLVDYSSNHIHLSNAKLNLDNNAVTDELKLAFSIVSKNEDSALEDIPSNARIMIEFTSNDTYGEGQWARFEVDIYDINTTVPSTALSPIVEDLSTNRYFVITKKLEELTKSPGFSWEIVKNIKVYASVRNQSDNPSSIYYVALDGLRFENVSTPNPLYGLTGYTVVSNNANNQPRTIIKSPNSTNYVEFRFEVDI